MRGVVLKSMEISQWESSDLSEDQQKKKTEIKSKDYISKIAKRLVCKRPKKKPAIESVSYLNIFELSVDRG